MKRYPILKNIYDFLENAQITSEYAEEMNKKGYNFQKEYILFEKENVGHISIRMTGRNKYELVSYHSQTRDVCGVNGHTEEFIDRIMKGQEF